MKYCYIDSTIYAKMKNMALLYLEHTFDIPWNIIRELDICVPGIEECEIYGYDYMDVACSTIMSMTNSNPCYRAVWNKILEYYKKLFTTPVCAYHTHNNIKVISIVDDVLIVTELPKSEHSIGIVKQICIRLFDFDVLDKFVTKHKGEIDFGNFYFYKWQIRNDIDNYYELFLESMICKSHRKEFTKNYMITELEYIKEKYSITDVVVCTKDIPENRDYFIAYWEGKDGNIKELKLGRTLHKLAHEQYVKFVQRLIDTKFYGKMSYVANNIPMTPFRQNVRRIVLNTIKEGMTFEQVIQCIFSDPNIRIWMHKVSESLSLKAIPNSVSVGAAFDVKNDVFYDKRVAFDFLTIDVGIDKAYDKDDIDVMGVITEYKCVIANYALEVLLRHKSVKKYNIPRNYFKLTGMTYLRNINVVRCQFGLKSLKK